jgi:hypothetical protein
MTPREILRMRLRSLLGYISQSEVAIADLEKELAGQRENIKAWNTEIHAIDIADMQLQRMGAP